MAGAGQRFPSSWPTCTRPAAGQCPSTTTPPRRHTSRSRTSPRLGADPAAPTNSAAFTITTWHEPETVWGTGLIFRPGRLRLLDYLVGRIAHVDRAVAGPAGLAGDPQQLAAGDIFSAASEADPQLPALVSNDGNPLGLPVFGELIDLHDPALHRADVPRDEPVDGHQRRGRS